jgi:hypothetical protein
MSCLNCGSPNITGKCIICEKDLCDNCMINCDLQKKDVCIQRIGDYIVWRCPGTLCPTDAKEWLIFTCKDCQIKFCKTVIGDWAKPCPTCKDHICGDCYDQHIKTCTTFYDKEEALDKLYKLIQGDKKK